MLLHSASKREGTHEVVLTSLPYPLQGIIVVRNPTGGYQKYSWSQRSSAISDYSIITQVRGIPSRSVTRRVTELVSNWLRNRWGVMNTKEKTSLNNPYWQIIVKPQTHSRIFQQFLPALRPTNGTDLSLLYPGRTCNFVPRPLARLPPSADYRAVSSFLVPHISFHFHR